MTAVMPGPITYAPISSAGVEARPNRRAIAESGWQSGSAQRHRIDADILKGKPVSLSAYGLYQSGGPSFRKPPRSGMSQPLSIGEISELGASLGLDKLRFDIKQQDSDVGGRERQRLETKVAYRPVTLSMFQQENARVQNGITQRREDTIGGAVKFDLDKYRHGDEEDGGFSMWRLLPSSISLGAERSRIQYGDDFADPKGLGTGLSLGLYWGWNQADTDISIYRKSRVIGSSTAHETDIGLDFSHTIYSGNWDLSAYLSIGSFTHNETDNNFHDLWAAGGVSASYYPEHFPDIALAVDFNHYNGVYPDFAERFGDQALTFDLAVDLSKYLAETNFAPSLKIHYYAFPNQTWASFGGGSESIEHAIGVTMAFRF